MRARTVAPVPTRAPRPAGWVVLLLLLTFLSSATMAAAAPPLAHNPPGPGLPLRRLMPGHALRFQIDAGKTLEARYYMLRGDSAYLVGIDGNPRAVPLDRMARIWKRRGSAAAGAAIAAGSAAVGVMALGTGSVMVPAGAVLGAVVGAFFPRWQKIYEAPAADAPRAPDEPLRAPAQPFPSESAFRMATPPPGLSGWLHGAQDQGFQHTFWSAKGQGFSAGLLWATTRNLAFGLELGRTWVEGTMEPDWWDPREQFSVEGSVLRAGLVTRVRPWQGPVRPYLLAGLEFCREESMTSGGSDISETYYSETYYGVQGGPGLQIGSPRISLGLQASVHLLAGSAQTESFFTVRAGLDWK